MMAALQCHDDIKVCRICVGWLLRRAGGVDVTPTLPVTDIDIAAGFYDTAGFEVRRYDDGFAFVSLNDQSVFDLLAHLVAHTGASVREVVEEALVARWATAARATAAQVRPDQPPSVGRPGRSGTSSPA